MRAELEVTPLAELLAELEQRDPLTYARIDRQNPRRVIRAVEVIRLTGKPFSTQRANWNPEVRSQKSEVIFCFSREPADLRARIETRVDTMFAGGLVEETRRLLARGLAGHRHAMQALGYRQVAAHLAGERGLAETIALVKTKTWQFARRQGTWFRSQLSVERVPLAADADATSVARGLLTGTGEEVLSSHPTFIQPAAHSVEWRWCSARLSVGISPTRIGT